jgi:microcystin-dependent protein
MAQPTKKLSAVTAVCVALVATTFLYVVDGGVSKKIYGAVLQPTGIMSEYAGTTAPGGWLLCQGQAVSRTAYSALYDVIGTTWGVGDNSTTFNLPDMREAAPVGAGTYTAVSGTTHGTITAHDARALGAFADDQTQGHVHPLLIYVGGGGAGTLTINGASSSNSGNTTVTSAISPPSNDGTNGTPRTGTVTRGKTIGVNYIIKY